jgi:uncharacterized repeat protein (TIGR01451 family)
MAREEKMIKKSIMQFLLLTTVILFNTVIACGESLPDLTLLSLDAPTSASTQQEIEVSWTGKNQGDGDVVSQWVDGFYLSTDTQLDSSDITLPDFWSTSNSLPAGESYTSSMKFGIPDITPGTYYLLAMTDKHSWVNESREWNNVLSRLITIGEEGGLSEASSHESNLTEDLLSQAISLIDVEVSGDLTGTLNFTNFEVVSVDSGSFKGKGFCKGEWTAMLEGASYSGYWRGVYYPVESERRIYLKGEVYSAEAKGIVEGYLTESVSGSSVYDQYHATWKLGRLGDVFVSVELNLEGVMSYGASQQYPSTQLHFSQIGVDGTTCGHYTEPINTVLTNLVITSQDNPYFEEGFSIISYTSKNGSGQGWAYDRVLASGEIELAGMFTSPLMGIVFGNLDENTTPKTLSLSIERVDLGLPPAAEPYCMLLAPGRMSPGQTITYVIEYRNDGVKAFTDAAVVFCMDPLIEYVFGSKGAQYIDGINEVAWNLGDIPAKAIGHLFVQGRAIWGLPSGINLHNYAFLESFQWHSTIIGTIRNGIKLPHDEYFEGPEGPEQREQYRSWRSVASKYNSAWQPILNTESDFFGFADSLHAAFASPVFGDGEGNPISTIFNGLNQSCESMNYSIEYSGGNAVGDGALKLGKETISTSEGEIFTRYKISAVLFDPDILLPLYKEKGIGKVVLYQSEYDDILDYNGTIYYNREDGWDIEVENGGFITKLPPGFIAKMLGATNAIHLFEAEAGKQIEWLQVSMSTQSDGKYGRDRISIKISGEENPTVLYLQGNPRTGELFKQSDFANIEGIEVEIRDRSMFKMPHVGWQTLLLCEDILTGKYPTIGNNIFGVVINEIAVAVDPNELSVSPEGNVKPGDTLTYTVQYENEGEGIAYGVYFTDTLEEDLDETTLNIGPVLDSVTGEQIGEAGAYNPETRTITWFVGEVGPGQGGSAIFSVNVKETTPNESEVINYATVYFPSVPEETRTNGIVNKVSTFVDNIPPTTTASISPEPNQEGWNKADVTINLSATDGEEGSGVREIHYILTGAISDEGVISDITASILISSEGATTLTYWSVDNIGNVEAQKTMEIKLDKTVPMISAVISPQPNSYGWNNTDVTVTFNASDELSGIATSTAPVAVSLEGENQHIGGEAVDVAGNQAATYVTLNIDKTDPEISITSPEENKEYFHDEAIPLIYTVTDSLSQVASSVITLDGVVLSNPTEIQTTVGTHALVITATDKAGNQAVLGRNFAVKLKANVTIKPEVFLRNNGVFIAFVKFPHGYDAKTITDATCDGAQAKRIISLPHNISLLIFRREEITDIPIDTIFTVRGHFGNGLLFEGGDTIKRVMQKGWGHRGDKDKEDEERELDKAIDEAWGHRGGNQDSGWIKRDIRGMNR